LEKFLDTAYAHGLPCEKIIHGHGSGKLRKAIEKFLDDHPCVEKRRVGLAGEGGGAVTVAEFKK
ncbi:MAG: Smr/MutS family protein, partial [Candidatus Sumerlaeaceae bacterium]|nr:Smr/MutS family protein [Candidatus Sumerlaeaceae bacterium]